MVFNSISYVLISLSCVVGVRFYTLLERKILGLGHLRTGPALIPWRGILQPLADGLKLFSKEIVTLKEWRYSLYWLSPGLLLGGSVLYVSFLIDGLLRVSYVLGGLLFLIVMGTLAYPYIIVGWSPTSAWRLLGAVRSLAQVISYEIRLSFILLIILGCGGCYSLRGLEGRSGRLGVMLGIGMAWLIRIVAELNRSPWDLGEAESELVSGVNIEFGGGLFGMLFVAEYLAIIVLSFLRGRLLIGRGTMTLLTVVRGCLILVGLIWLRLSTPRIRYDSLIRLCWLVLLPMALLNIMWLVCL